MNEHVITDVPGSDASALAQEVGVGGKFLIPALDKAVNVQTSAIEGYINWLRRQHPTASPTEIQAILDKHFTRLVTTSGAGVGAAAAIPGIGFVTGALAIGAESVVFLDAAAVYTMASAHLRGIDIREEERRRALILVIILGSAGTAVVDATLGDFTNGKGTSASSAISRFSAQRLLEVNNHLIKVAIKKVGRRLRAAWLGKILPLGVGAVLGTLANRELARRVIGNSHDSLGPLPEKFDAELTANPGPDEAPLQINTT